MTLKQAIKRIEERFPDYKIKIGAKHGSGFFFVGSIPEYWEHYDRLCRISEEFSRDAWLQAEKLYGSKDEKKKRAIAQRAKDRYESYMEPNLRNVTDVFGSDTLIDDAIIIMVEGYENGRYWTTGERAKKDTLEPIAVGMTQKKRRKFWDQL